MGGLLFILIKKIEYKLNSIRQSPICFLPLVMFGFSCSAFWNDVAKLRRDCTKWEFGGYSSTHPMILLCAPDSIVLSS